MIHLKLKKNNLFFIIKNKKSKPKIDCVHKLFSTLIERNR